MSMAPILKNTKYSGNVLNCDNNSFLFQYETDIYEFKLFNLLYYQDGREEVCRRLLQAAEIEIEIDLLAPSNEPYVFIEQELLQEYLINEQYARIKLRNPEYKYFEIMKSAQTEGVSNEVEFHDAGREFDRTRGNQFFFIQFFVIFLTAIYFILRKIIKKVI